MKLEFRFFLMGFFIFYLMIVFQGKVTLSHLSGITSLITHLENHSKRDKSAKIIASRWRKVMEDNYITVDELNAEGVPPASDVSNSKHPINF